MNEQTIEQERHAICNERLTKLFETDQYFSKTISQNLSYYLSHLSKSSRDKASELEPFLSAMYESIFYQGYFLLLTLRDHPETTLSDEFLSQPNGRLKEQVVSMMKDAISGDTKTIIEFTTAQPLLLTYEGNEEIIEMLMEWGTEILMMGAHQALIDERSNRNLFIQVEPKTKGYLHRLDDFLFICPNKYLVCTARTEHSEQWEMRQWQTTSNPKQVGTVILQHVTSEQLEQTYSDLPYYDGIDLTYEDRLLITVLFTEGIIEHEQLPIIQEIYSQVKERTSVRNEQIIFSMAATDNIQNLVANVQ